VIAVATFVQASFATVTSTGFAIFFLLTYPLALLIPWRGFFAFKRFFVFLFVLCR
jgi:hypothetical protein